MVDRIGQGTSLARTAIEAALKRQAEASARMSQAVAAEAPKVAETPRSDFSKALVQGLADVDADVKRADGLVDGVLSGKIQDFHEVAAALKQSELSFKFALEVRNKFVDAYREVMRMTV
jgi:flagellar hook-basal body complex protein FliE